LGQGDVSSRKNGALLKFKIEAGRTGGNEPVLHHAGLEKYSPTHGRARSACLTSE